MSKRPSKDIWQRYESHIQIIGFVLTCVLIGFVFVANSEDPPIFILSLIALFGFLGATISPILLGNLSDNINRRRSSRVTQAENEHKAKPKQSKKSVKRFIPHILTEPVPNDPPEEVFTRERIFKIGKLKPIWSEKSEQVIIQLLQEFNPEDRPQARRRLQELKWLNEPGHIIAALLEAQGDLKKLDLIVKHGNMDYRDLLQVFYGH